MAFAVEPYIFDWIFFDDSSELKNLAVLTCEKNGNKMSTQGCIYSPLTLAQCVHISSGVGVCVAYSCEWAAKALSSG